MKCDLVVIGSHAPAMFIDVQRTPRPGETVLGRNFREPQDGGKGSNQAIAAARLGAKVSFVGMVGNDRPGRELKDWLDKEGIDHQWLQVHPTTGTGMGFNLQTDDGDCALVTSMGANARIDENLIDESMTELKDSRILLTQFEIPPAIALYACKVGKRLGMQTILNPAPAQYDKDLDYHSVSILVPNEIEAKTLLNLPAEYAIQEKPLCAQMLEKLKVDCVIITQGEKGVAGMDKNGYWDVEAPRVECADASGAGDEFCAALAAAMVRGMDVKSASAWAVNAASFSVTKEGTIPSFPFLKDVNQFIRDQKETRNQPNE